jgi:hypothetical protein
MRHLINLISIIFLSSCLDKTQTLSAENLTENSKYVTITLRDSLGTASLFIPRHFDTSFTWTNFSDCGKSCNKEEYRYQKRSLPIFKESGFYYVVPDISVDQFTIIHSSYIPFYVGDTSKNVGRHHVFKRKLASEPDNGRISLDTIEKIGDRYFSIICSNGFDSVKQKHFAKVAAMTTVKSNEIEFHYDIRTKDTINLKEFYLNSIKLLRTVRMSNGI